MADEAKIVVELLDRSGNNAATPGPNNAGNAQVPGSDLNQQFHQQVSAQGAGSKTGAGSVSSVPTSTPISQPSASPTTPVATLPSQPSGDPLLDVVRGLLGADSNVKASEIGTALGISQSRAEDLLTRAQSFNQPTPSTSSAPAPTTTPTLPTQPSTGKPELSEFLGAPHKPGSPIDLGDIGPEMDMAANAAARGLTRNLGSLVAGSIGGPVGSAVGMMANQAAPAIGNAVGASSMAPIMAAAAPALVAAGAITAAIAADAALVGAVNGEIGRAYGQIRDINPDVALSDAQNELRQLRANFRTSDRLGDEVATQNTANSQLSTQIQGLKDRIIEGPSDVVALGTKAAAVAVKATNATYDLADYILSGLDERYGGVIKRVNVWLDTLLGEKEDESVSSFDWFDHQPHLPLPGGWEDGGDVGNLEYDEKDLITGLRF